MTTGAQKQNVPRLRFPEFGDEWISFEIGSLLKIGNGRDYKHLKIGKIPVYGTGGVMLYVDEYLYYGESVCIGRKGTIDKPQFVHGKFWTVDTLFYTHNFKNSIPKFVYLIFQNINWLKYNEASGVPSLSKSTIEKIKVHVPTLPEQQKIATFLTTVDDKISLLTKKVDNLEKYKKGLMNQVFSQKIRFKDDKGEVFSDWEIKKLGELCNIVTGKLDANAMVENGAYRFYTCAKDYFKIDNFAFDTEALLISGNGANVGYIHYYKGKFNAYQRTYILDAFKCKIRYVEHYLTENLSLQIAREKKDGNTPYIVLDTLKNMKISIPKNMLEQQKIATLLTSLDDKITHTRNQLDKTKEFKKALMQRMFV